MFPSNLWLTVALEEGYHGACGNLSTTNGKACLWSGLVCFSCLFSVSLGTLPGGSALAGLPQSDGGGGSSREEGEGSAAQLATQASSLMALLTSRAALDTP